MRLVLKGGTVYTGSGFAQADVAVEEGRIVSVSSSVFEEGSSVIELHDQLVVPGFVDVHVHLRQPGFSYKETIYSGTSAAAAGGYTAVCAMPNLKPVPDCMENLREQLRLIEKDAKVRVYPYGAITVGQKGGELADLAAMAPCVCGFSDDGRGVQNETMMRRAMEKVKALDKHIVAHCEDEALLAPGWAIHDGEFCRALGLVGNDPASEWRQVERDIALVRETGCKYHVCHISTKESVELIRKAKAEGLQVTCETAPHYLVLTEDDLEENGRFKMNPPLREKKDRDALIEGVLDGTIDMIATDHAPHSAEEKSRGLEKSSFGISGIETAFPVLYTYLVKEGILTLGKLTELLCLNPRKRFGIGLEKEDYTVFETETPYKIDPENFVSKGKSTPFAGRTVYGKCMKTVLGGKTVWQENMTEN